MTKTQEQVLRALADRKAQKARGSEWRNGDGLNAAALAACKRNGWAESWYDVGTKRTQWRITAAGSEAILAKVGG